MKTKLITLILLLIFFSCNKKSRDKFEDKHIESKALEYVYSKLIINKGIIDNNEFNTDTSTNYYLKSVFTDSIKFYSDNKTFGLSTIDWNNSLKEFGLPKCFKFISVKRAYSDYLEKIKTNKPKSLVLIFGINKSSWNEFKLLNHENAIFFITNNFISSNNIIIVNVNFIIKKFLPDSKMSTIHLYFNSDLEIICWTYEEFIYSGNYKFENKL